MCDKLYQNISKRGTLNLGPFFSYCTNRASCLGTQKSGRISNRSINNSPVPGMSTTCLLKMIFITARTLCIVKANNRM
jgi:hypothetical protein